MPLEKRVIKRTRSKWIKKEVIYPTHTDVYLTAKGKSALKKIRRYDPALYRLFKLDITMGGGCDADRGILFFARTRGTTVASLWKKAVKHLRKFAIRGKPKKLSGIEVFKKHFGVPIKKNLITNQILSHGLINPYMAYEVSSGTFFKSKVYGVTIVTYNPKTGKTKSSVRFSKSFTNYQDARSYITSLKKKYKGKKKRR